MFGESCRLRREFSWSIGLDLGLMKTFRAPVSRRKSSMRWKDAFLFADYAMLESLVF